jgi:MFS superfamily sulfate permease-like transporter
LRPNVDFSVSHPEERGFAFSASEVTGAVGDSATVLPVVVAVAALTDLGLPLLLLWFGVFQVVWGLRYGAPVSVEPMKALAALVIAGSLTVPELAVAGTLAGVVLLGLGSVGALGALAERIDRAVIRGVQLAVALVLARTGLELGVGAPKTALAAALVGGVVVALGRPRASALAVLGFGIVFAGAETGMPQIAVPEFVTVVALVPNAGVAAFAPTPDALSAAGAQLAMTVGNAAVATSLLLDDLFDAEVSPDELATSMGAMNLLAVPLGALPMCHGSGGVAGKYAFGARTAGANLVLGALYVGAAFAAAELVAAFPMAALGVVLVLVAAQLGRTSLDTDSLGLTAGVGMLGLATNVGLAFLAGIAASAVLARVRTNA